MPLYNTTTLSLGEAVRQNVLVSEFSKKLPEHVTAVKEREAHLTTEVAELLK